MSTSKPKVPEGNEILSLFATYLFTLLQRASEGGDAIPSATLAVISKFLSDNSITLASIRKGDFGEVAQKAAEEFPFNDDGSLRGDTMMGTSAKAH